MIKFLKNNLFFIIIFMIIFLFFTFINKFSVNVPFWDEWQLVSLFKDIYNSQNNWWNILVYKHNEHLIGFAFFIMIFKYIITDINIKYELYFGGILQVFSFVFFYIETYKDIPKNRLSTWAILVALCFFSFCQYQNILWGFQTAWFLITALVISVLIILNNSYANNQYSKIYIAGFLGLLASFTSTQGILVWPAGMILLAAIEEFNFTRLLKNPGFWRWVLMAIITGILYITVTMSQWAGSPQGSESITVKNLLIIFFGLYGAIFGLNNLKITLGIGVIVFSMVLMGVIKIIKSKNKSIYALPLALVFFGASFNFLVTIGRVKFGIGVIQDSHYTAYTLLILVGTLTIFFIEDHNNQPPSLLSTLVGPCLIATTALFAISSAYSGVLNAIQWHKDRELAVQIVLSPELRSNNFLVERILFGDADYVRKNIAFMEENSLGIFAGKDGGLNEKNPMLVAMPDRFSEIIKDDPSYRDAVTSAWYAYLSDGGLRRAFNRYDPSFDYKLIQWCYGAAIDGKHHLSPILAPFSKKYEKILMKINKGRT